jgi:hypothetical protein
MPKPTLMHNKWVTKIKINFDFKKSTKSVIEVITLIKKMITLLFTFYLTPVK